MLVVVAAVLKVQILLVLAVLEVVVLVLKTLTPVIADLPILAVAVGDRGS
tara:strand:- start:33 stop:182 length:150 start_codon:yes stop_codon:yes gene_type:complete